jgi:hypothetical protein
LKIIIIIKFEIPLEMRVMAGGVVAELLEYRMVQETLGS